MKRKINVTITYTHIVDGETKTCTYNGVYKYIEDPNVEFPQRFHELQLTTSFRRKVYVNLINLNVTNIEWHKDTIVEYTPEYYCQYYQMIVNDNDKCKKCDIHCLHNTNQVTPNYLHEKS